MRVETNQRLIKRNTRIANYLFIITFGVLIAGFFGTNILLASAETNSVVAILAAPVLLVLSLTLTFSSIRMTNTWARQPRPENVLEDGLKGLSNKSILYNYHHNSARHVLICPQGVFAITTRWQAGQHSVIGTEEKDVWHSKRKLMGQILSVFRLDSLGDPSKDAEKAAVHVQVLLATDTSDTEVKVQPLVVFLDPKATLELDNPHVPVVYADGKSKPNIRDYLREMNRGQDDKGKGGKKSNNGDLLLSGEQIEAFEAATLKPQ